MIVAIDFKVPLSWPVTIDFLKPLSFVALSIIDTKNEDMYFLIPPMIFCQHSLFTVKIASHTLIYTWSFHAIFKKIYVKFEQQKMSLKLEQKSVFNASHMN